MSFLSKEFNLLNDSGLMDSLNFSSSPEIRPLILLLGGPLCPRFLESGLLLGPDLLLSSLICIFPLFIPVIVICLEFG